MRDLIPFFIATLLCLMLGMIIVIKYLECSTTVIIPPAESFMPTQSTADIMVKGLCMFDLDGTLSDGIENSRVVQACIDSGYEVGIVTAGGRYTIDTLADYPWIPKNLLERMAQTGFITFNNVVRNVLAGRERADAYTKIDAQLPAGINIYGWRKGFACTITANLLGITDKIIVLDDLPLYLSGIKSYNPNIHTVCAGFECGGSALSISTLNLVL